MRTCLECGAAALLGCLAVVLPVLVDPPARHHEAALFPVMGDAVEGMHLISLLFLAVIGGALGAFGGASRWCVGLSTMLAFPLWSLCDLIVGEMRTGDGGHSLLGIEWFVYLVCALPAVAGAFAGRWIRKISTR